MKKYSDGKNAIKERQINDAERRLLAEIAQQSIELSRLMNQNEYDSLVKQIRTRGYIGATLIA
jgi:hypothetical protein